MSSFIGFPALPASPPFLPQERQPMMKQYQCHKTVLAAKIVNISTMRHDDGPATVKTTLHLEGGSFVAVEPEWVAKHVPHCGGYYVQYADGYASFSPAKAFESGYTEVLA